MHHKPWRLAFVMAAALAHPAAAADFTLVSPSLAGGTIPETFTLNGFGCTGGNVSPALRWSGAPAGTKSFAVTLYDPDAPTGSGWWHWVAFNIPANVGELPEGAGSVAGKPSGMIEGMTDFGTAGYGGPCPPAGDKPHRYIFTVNALKVEALPLDAKAPPAMVGFMIGQNRIGSATLELRYGR